MSFQGTVTEMTDAELAQFYAWPNASCVRINMVLDAGANSTGHDETSHSLASAVDRRVLREIRREAQVVIVGAESVRREGWFLPPAGVLFVLSRSGELPWQSCPDRTRVHVFADVSALSHAALNTGTRILCEGGFNTAHLIDERLGFDQIALTVHGNPQAALSRITEHTADFREQHNLSAMEHSNERFVLWRRAIPNQGERQF